MRPLVVLVEFLVYPSFVAQFRDLIAANAKTSLKREIGCKRFDVLVDPEVRGASSSTKSMRMKPRSTNISPRAIT
jgi:quinol monooxygenase YgiN